MKHLLIFILLLMTLICFGKKNKVTRVIDGDTFVIETGEKVRLIGINAPEISDIFGIEAKNHLKDLIENRNVELVPDYLSKDKDRYQRLLRYVLIDNTDINKKMISDGYAFAYLKYKFTKSNDYKQAQLDSKEMSCGMWDNFKGEKNIEKHIEKSPNIFLTISPKGYLIVGLVLFLIFIGLYYYFKK